MKEPNVLCIGFAKCGTTTLYDIFKQHKDIYLSNIKEPLFWGNQLLESRGYEWYLDRYYHFANKDVVMEINPIIGKYKTAEEIKSNYPANTKIVIMIRNPIQRLYSNFKMNLIDGTSFHTIKDNLTDSTSMSFEKWLFDEYVSYDGSDKVSFVSQPRMYKNGNYFNVIHNYINTFGKENVKIIFFEDFIKDTKKVCEDLMNFIGVENDKSINYDIHSNSGNRLPLNEESIKILNFIFKNIIYNLEITPFIKNEKYDKLINIISWKLFDIFSKKTINDKVTDLSYNILSLYYNEMLALLCNELNEDLYSKWGIDKDEKQIYVKIKQSREKMR